jgi:hypothetical protein
VTRADLSVWSADDRRARACLAALRRDLRVHSRRLWAFAGPGKIGDHTGRAMWSGLGRLASTERGAVARTAHRVCETDEVLTFDLTEVTDQDRVVCLFPGSQWLPTW